MKTVLSFYLFISICLCFSTRHPNHKEINKSPSSQCCLAKGGSICGTVLQDCCKNGCEPWYLGSQWCKESEKLSPECDTCTKVCKAKNGLPCAVQVDTGRVSCCNQQHCLQNKTYVREQPGIGTKLLEYATGKLLSSVVSHNMVDQFIQSVVGPSDYCEKGHEIQLGECIADSFVSLLEAKVLE